MYAQRHILPILLLAAACGGPPEVLSETAPDLGQAASVGVDFRSSLPIDRLHLDFQGLTQGLAPVQLDVEWKPNASGSTRTNLVIPAGRYGLTAEALKDDRVVSRGVNPAVELRAGRYNSVRITMTAVRPGESLAETTVTAESNALPSIDLVVEDLEVTEAEPVRVAVRASDPDGDAITVTASIAGAGSRVLTPCGTQGFCTTFPPLRAGNHDVRFTVRDARGATDRTMKPLIVTPTAVTAMRQTLIQRATRIDAATGVSLDRLALGCADAATVCPLSATELRTVAQYHDWLSREIASGEVRIAADGRLSWNGAEDVLRLDASGVSVLVLDTDGLARALAGTAPLTEVPPSLRPLAASLSRDAAELIAALTADGAGAAVVHLGHPVLVEAVDAGATIPCRSVAGCGAARRAPMVEIDRAPDGDELRVAAPELPPPPTVRWVQVNETWEDGYMTEELQETFEGTRPVFRVQRSYAWATPAGRRPWMRGEVKREDSDGDGDWDRTTTWTYEEDAAGRRTMSVESQDRDGNGTTDYEIRETWLPDGSKVTEVDPDGSGPATYRRLR